ncbi:MAG: type II toxin-antitoxin system VapC family toxin [Thaumarchaeota archaeon]|nr:type II toxin-antitoxin system VapC family toxin [Nitrososphaerota archaeon]
MKALLDASSLLLLVKHADATKLADVAKDLTTLDLAAYEAGNAIWKQVHLQKLVTHEEARATHEALIGLLSHLSLVRGEELNQTEAMNLAIRKGIAYYDACYLVASESLELPLATEDRKLAAAKARREVIGWEQVLGDGTSEGDTK